MSLTDISKKIGLSIDSVKKRIQRMIKEDVFFPKIQLRPRNFGFKNIIEAKIKLQNYDGQKINEFINYLQENPYVVEIISISGEWDYTIVLITKDALDVGGVVGPIRRKFHDIISEWSESLTTSTYKFEDYDMSRILGFEED